MEEYAFTERHMGTEVTISLITPTHEVAQSIATRAFAIIREYEARFSRFLETSELTKLNTQRDMCVSEEFFTVLARSYELYTATSGAFNPLVQITKHGYTDDYALIKDTERESSTTTYNTDFSSVIMDKKTRRVILHDTQALDFGGFLKGYLAHLISTLIDETYSECTGNIVNIGGDLHTRGYDEYGNPFVFAIYNPVHKTEFSVPITNMSLATSGTYARSWHLRDGTTRHHILSPSDVTSTETHYVSASIIHEDGGTAEAYTKLFLVGDPHILEQTKPRDTYRYFLITHSGDVIHSQS